MALFIARYTSRYLAPTCGVKKRPQVFPGLSSTLHAMVLRSSGETRIGAPNFEVHTRNAGASSLNNVTCSEFSLGYLHEKHKVSSRCSQTASAEGAEMRKVGGLLSGRQA